MAFAAEGASEGEADRNPGVRGGGFGADFVEGADLATVVWREVIVRGRTVSSCVIGGVARSSRTSVCRIRFNLIRGSILSTLLLNPLTSRGVRCPFLLWTRSRQPENTPSNNCSRPFAVSN